MASRVRNVVRSAQFRLGGAAVAREAATASVAFAAIVLSGVVLQRITDLPLLPYACIIGGMAALAVLLYRLRLPRPLAAAAELDRQFRLNESISTAMQISGSDDDAFRSAARSHGEQAAQTVEPRDLNPGGWGHWQWLAALVMLGIVPTIYAPATPVGGQASTGVSTREQDASQTISASIATAAQTRRQHQTPTGESGTGVIPQGVADHEQETGRPAPRASQGQMAGVSPGGGFAQGYAPPESPRPMSTVRLPRGRTTSAAPATDSSGGNGRSIAAVGKTDATGAVESAASDTTTGAATQPGSANGNSPDTGDMPAAYRDIVKAYYRR